MSPVVRVARRTYPIVGSTAAEISRALERFGPRGVGRSFAAHTEWAIRYSLEPHGPSVELEARITLPRWIPPRGASDALLAEWERYLAALEAHEEGHVERGRRAAEELGRALADLAAGDVAGARALASTIEARARAAERAYDRETAHGRAEGAELRVAVDAPETSSAAGVSHR